MPPIIQHSDVDFLARLFKGLEIGDHVIGNTPGGFKIHAARGAGHESYAGFKPADHIVAANMHAKEARNLNIKATQLGGSATLKRQAANHLNIAAGHREMGSGAAQTKLAASFSGKERDMMAADAYASVLIKASGAGSRGGHVIGETRTGQPIYASGHAVYAKGKQVAYSKTYRKFSSNDHLDAANAHEAAKHAAVNKVNKLKRTVENSTAGSAKHSNASTKLQAARKERDTHMRAEHAHIAARDIS